MLNKLLLKNRSYRRFYEDYKIDEQELRKLIEFVRLSPSPRNQQALKFFISNIAEKNERIFETLAWAGALKDWNGPEEGERPSAYIIILGDNSILPEKIKPYHEVASGIVAQSIMLGAVEKGYGGCMIAAIKRKPLREYLELPEHLEILLVLALGKPKEQIKLVEIPGDGNYNYWRDDEQIHHVPKRSLEEIIIKTID